MTFVVTTVLFFGFILFAYISTRSKYKKLELEYLQNVVKSKLGPNENSPPPRRASETSVFVKDAVFEPRPASRQVKFPGNSDKELLNFSSLTFQNERHSLQTWKGRPVLVSLNPNLARPGNVACPGPRESRSIELDLEHSDTLSLSSEYKYKGKNVYQSQS